MIDTLLYGYLTGWVLTSIGLAVTVHRLQHPARPQPHPIALSIAASAVWPVLILGAAQMAVVALATEAIRRRGSGPGELPAEPAQEKVSDSGWLGAPNSERNPQHQTRSIHDEHAICASRSRSRTSATATPGCQVPDRQPPRGTPLEECL
ncbi:MAG: hypothetical protein QOH54_3843 [Mycobacterium sp.]|nr:hypothetical protein [Mycobacterium sp.]